MAAHICRGTLRTLYPSSSGCRSITSQGEESGAHNRTMSTVAVPEPTVEAAAVSNPGERVSSVGERFHSCWSCRLLSGGGLIAGGLYVLRAAKSVMRTGAPPSIGLAMQITFAASKTPTFLRDCALLCPWWMISRLKLGTNTCFAGLGAWGVVVIADPVGKAKKSPDTWMPLWNKTI